MEKIGNWIADILSRPNDPATEKRVAAGVREICEAFPLYTERMAEYARS